MYVVELVLTAETKEKVEIMFRNWEHKLEKRGLRVNTGKTKMMVAGKREKKYMQVRKYPCGICASTVGANSICICVTCDPTIGVLG